MSKCYVQMFCASKVNNAINRVFTDHGKSLNLSVKFSDLGAPGKGLDAGRPWKSLGKWDVVESPSMVCVIVSCYNTVIQLH